MSKSEEKWIKKMNRALGINQQPKETINPLKEPWYFESAKDKIILLIVLILAVWKIFNLIGGLF
ncbi:MAG: hypothetical protein DRN27_06480 [Thermoplasmata archaeon]|nr:MAG: hypothetical protein DRN27_06480 [Thermoplasmata archaeon]